MDRHPLYVHHITFTIKESGSVCRLQFPAPVLVPGMPEQDCRVGCRSEKLLRVGLCVVFLFISCLAAGSHAASQFFFTPQLETCGTPVKFFS
jgi:hypothetical protein